MPTFSYNRDIPAAGNNPSTDQPNMKTNTNSTDDLIDVDHYSFDEANGGWHRQSTYVTQTKPTTTSGQNAVYAKQASGLTNLFCTEDNSGNEYQLTSVDNTNFASFGNFTNYHTPVDQKGGWTFLPGTNLILQYGTLLSTGSNTTVTFPKKFTTNLISVTVTRRSNSTAYGVSSPSTTGFIFAADSTSVGIDLYWMAIGN